MENPLTMREAMDAAGIKSRNTMKKYIRLGLVEATPLPGGHWRISGESIHRLLADDLRTFALDHLKRVSACQ